MLKEKRPGDDSRALTITDDDETQTGQEPMMRASTNSQAFARSLRAVLLLCRWSLLFRLDLLGGTWGRVQPWQADLSRQLAFVDAVLGL